MSKIGIGALILLLQEALQWFGFEIPNGTIETVVNAVLAIAGFALLLIGQLGRKDLKWGLIRK